MAPPRYTQKAKISNALITGYTAMRWYRIILAKQTFNTMPSILHSSWTTIGDGGNSGASAINSQFPLLFFSCEFVHVRLKLSEFPFEKN